MNEIDHAATRGVNGDRRKVVAVVQSAYIPWKGFFDLIARCDEYVILDSAQFAKRHWHNRNIVKTPDGPLWLTIPVNTKSRFQQPIDEVTVSGAWAEKHWKTITANYARAPYFDSFKDRLRGFYDQANSIQYLTAINELFIRGLSDMLGITTHITRDRTYNPQGRKTDRLVDICLKAGATTYLSGPSAKTYLEEAKFNEHGIAVEWMDYGRYAEYAQLWGEYVSAVSVIDLLLNAGLSRPDLWNKSAGFSKREMSDGARSVAQVFGR